MTYDSYVCCTLRTVLLQQEVKLYPQPRNVSLQSDGSGPGVLFPTMGCPCMVT